MSVTTSNKGILVVMSGFSGAGKGTVMKTLLNKYDNYALSVSATTRQPRPGEEEGVSYFFRTREEFEQMIREDALIEYAEYVNNYYGTPRSYVEQKLSEGYDVILEIEIQGALNIRKKFPDAVLLFVTPPSFEELENRLTGRGTESAEVIAGRMKQAAYESGFLPNYDYIILNENGKVEECADTVHEVIQTAHRRISHNQELVDSLQQGASKWK